MPATPDSGKASPVLGLTLAELGFLLFFLILLLSGHKIELRESENESLAEEVTERLAEEERLREELAEQGIEVEDLREAMALLIVGVDSDVVEEFTRLVKASPTASAAALRLMEENQAARDSIEKQLLAAGRYQEEMKQLKAQVTYLRRQEGYGPPPCWLNEKGQPMYILVVTIWEDGLVVAPDWPADRAEEAWTTPGIESLMAPPNGRWSKEEFHQRALPVLEWSQAQDPECRHFVRVFDQAESKAGFKTGLAAIEGYFYKYLEVSG